MMANFFIKFIMFSGMFNIVSSLPISDFFPFGTTASDVVIIDKENNTRLLRQDDAVLPITTPHIPFFNRINNVDVQISTNGYVAFGKTIYNRFVSLDFPFTGVAMIAPFWTDLEFIKTSAKFYYQIHTEGRVLVKASQEILRKKGVAFQPNFVLVVTWFKTNIYQNSAATVTVQLALACDATETFIFFLYNQLENLSKITSFGWNDGNSTQANFFKHPLHRMANVSKLVTTSNVGVNGEWIYRIGKPGGIFPRIRRKPTMEVTAQNNRLVFNCSLSKDVLDPRGVYEITWYNGDKKINKTDIFLNGSRTSLLMNENMFQSLYQLGVEISCKVRTWYTNTSNIKSPFHESNVYFAGIKVEPRQVVVTEGSEAAKVNVTNTVPIVCNNGSTNCEVTISFPYQRSDILLSTCMLSFKPNSSSMQELVIHPIQDFIDDGQTTVTITPVVNQSVNMFDWLNYSPSPPIIVTTTNVATALCSSSGDPYISTFDNTWYAFFNIGDFVLAQSVKNNFKIEFPSGASITFQVHRRSSRLSFANIYVQIPSIYHQKTEGLCGIFDGNRFNDMTSKEGTVYQQTNPASSIFVNSWKLRNRSSLFFTRSENKSCKRLVQYNTTSVCSCLLTGGVVSRRCGIETFAVRPTFASAINFKTIFPAAFAHCSNQSLSNTIIVPDEDDNTIYEYDPPDQNFVPKTWPTPTGKTQAQVEAFCDNAILNSTSGQACSLTLGDSFGIATFRRECISDILISDSYDYIQSIIDAMTTSCTETVLRGINEYWDMDNNGTLTPPATISNSICPNDCNGKGQCVNSTCSCNVGFEGADCSVNKNTPLSVVSSVELCDGRTKRCLTVSIEGSNIKPSSPVFCIFTPKVKWIYFNKRVCDPSRGTGRPYNTFYIQLSNGTHASAENKTFVIYDSKCIQCNSTSAVCQVKSLTCKINGYCFAEGESNPMHSSARCVPLVSQHNFTTTNAISCSNADISYVVVMDSSSSVRTLFPEEWGQQKTFVKNFAAQLGLRTNSRIRVGVVNYGSKANIVATCGSLKPAI
ncbi:von Willebrand factor D and EGF domain-containing protein-like isoform X2 [Hydractinia symbiolongicarpus]|uniref:von Willebrand factor D and EGF domain-containing protein-like isoform X2 n=1 Tax=Hydractinia symbiolongicarpus TaxID=13093 RepID=UPI00254BBA0F|nr:von Willebrand factor D and EGF domain-containing protein-like isoform X2 [Hydractinia symbiolongicarpus]